MKNLPSVVTRFNPGDTCGACEPGSQTLEVNVLFTDAESTALALKYAEALARDLGARICLRAAVTVPWQLDLNRPQVSVQFVEDLLRRLADHLGASKFRPTSNVYLCRDAIGTFRRVLAPQSLVVMGSRNYWWWRADRRMARALRAMGHRVVFIPVKERAAEKRVVEPTFAESKLAR